MQDAERHWCVDSENAPRRRAQVVERVDGVAGLIEDAAAMLVIGPPLVGQRQASRGPVEEPDAEPVLQFLDLLADRALGDAQLPRRAGKALGIDDGGENAHALKWIGSSHVISNCLV